MRAVYGAFLALLAWAAPGGMAQAPVKSQPSEVVGCSVLPALVRLADGSEALVVRFTVAPQWHIYWSNPGDSGVVTRVRAELPGGWSVGAPRLPRPQVLGTADERNYGYQKGVDVLVPVVRPAGDRAESIRARVRGEWMACKEACILGAATLEAQVSTDPQAYAPVVARSFPVPLPASVRAGREEGPAGAHALVLSFDAGAIAHSPVRFVPDAVAGVEWTEGTGPFTAQQRGTTISLRLPYRITAADAIDGPPRLRGLLLAGDREGDPAYTVDFLPSDVPVSGR